MANNGNGSQAAKGRGWKGDSAGHARAGKLGGLARSRRKSNNNSSSNSEE